MNFDMIGLHADSAINLVLKMYDSKPTEEEKISLLLNNRVVQKLNSVNLPQNFASGATIDINAGELLGLGVVVSYFDWVAAQVDGDTYQVGVGIEDSVKSQAENLLSDGAIWHDQSGKKMVVQQVMAQGYYPVKAIRDSDIVTQIENKAKKRNIYPESCALIVNVFSQARNFDLNKIRRDASQPIKQFKEVYLNIYELPSLEHAKVYYLSNPRAPSLIIALKRHPIDDKWYFNFDAKKKSVNK